MTYKEQRAEITRIINNQSGNFTTQDIVEEADASANPVYGILKHMSWDGELQRIDTSTWRKSDDEKHNNHSKDNTNR